MPNIRRLLQNGNCIRLVSIDHDGTIETGSDQDKAQRNVWLMQGAQQITIIGSSCMVVSSLKGCQNGCLE